MRKEKRKKLTKSTTFFSAHINKHYGKPGTIGRAEFQMKANAYAIGEIIKEERRQATIDNLTST